MRECSEHRKSSMSPTLAGESQPGGNIFFSSIESHKMLIWFDILPTFHLNIFNSFRVISFYIWDGRTDEQKAQYHNSLRSTLSKQRIKIGRGSRSRSLLGRVKGFIVYVWERTCFQTKFYTCNSILKIEVRDHIQFRNRGEGIGNLYLLSFI